jgi:hypothetical protein
MGKTRLFFTTTRERKSRNMTFSRGTVFEVLARLVFSTSSWHRRERREEAGAACLYRAAVSPAALPGSVY